MRRRQRRKRRLLVVTVLGLLVAAIVGYLGWNLGWTAAAEGDQAPPFVLPDHQGARWHWRIISAGAGDLHDIWLR